ncbi:hypothetical protein PR048_007899 [Dryococelus australis]|uniref:Uncharacterized protein n=1 Tax=Dryococelus australis TaxID=614101 RepID=A0ABQ9HVJ3_9NEOP|nr:hypothetical protein PR048_007899 [Dryococelus australis]
MATTYETRPDDVVVRLLASHLHEPGSIPGWGAPGYSHVGIVPHDEAGMRVFSRISRFSPPLHFRRNSILPSLHPQLPSGISSTCFFGGIFHCTPSCDDSDISEEKKPNRSRTVHTLPDEQWTVSPMRQTHDAAPEKPQYFSAQGQLLPTPPPPPDSVLGDLVSSPPPSMQSSFSEGATPWCQSNTARTC